MGIARDHHLFSDPPEAPPRHCKHCDYPCCGVTSSSLAYCPSCGLPVCPACGSRYVVQISRVTGYLQDVSGWNASKKQELKDRKRYDI